MREVIPELLWIGNARDARDVAAVGRAGIRAVIDLAIEEPPARLPREVIYCRLPLLDGGGNEPSLVQLAVQTTAFLIRTKTPTLVACSGGMSRSPAIVAAAMASLTGEAVDKVLQSLADHGPQDVSPGLWAEIRAAAEETDRSASDDQAL